MRYLFPIVIWLVAIIDSLYLITMDTPDVLKQIYQVLGWINLWVFMILMTTVQEILSRGRNSQGEVKN
jgi:hypothetical protein